MEMDFVRKQLHSTDGPSTQHAWADAMEVEDEGGTKIMPTEEIGDEKEGEEVNAPLQRTPPTRTAKA